MLGTLFGGVLTSWNRTIQRPASAAIERIPAIRDQSRTCTETRFARKLRRRISEVLRGHPLPPRYCHISQRTAAIAKTDQGNAGPVLKLRSEERRVGKECRSRRAAEQK